METRDPEIIEAQLMLSRRREDGLADELTAAIEHTQALEQELVLAEREWHGTP